jgi:hypothetical protein
MRDKYLKSKRVNVVIATIQRGEFTIYANVAREYKCDCKAVSRQIKGLTKSRKEALSFWHQCLIDEQEEVLI